MHWPTSLDGAGVAEAKAVHATESGWSRSASQGHPLILLRQQGIWVRLLIVTSVVEHVRALSWRQVAD